MAGIPSIPPLLCNTPPPIDFGEEDDDSGLPPTLTLEDEDDYGDFALGADINEDTTNAEVSSLPRTPQFELSSSTTSGFTDIPPAFEDCGTLSITPTEFNNSTANEEVKTQIQLNEAFNYNVTQTFSSANGENNNNNTLTTDAMRELEQINNSDTPPAQQNVNDNKPLDIDSNEAKATTTTSTLKDQAETLTEITTKEDSQVGDSNAATSEPETEVKSNFMPIISQSPPPLADLVLLEDLADDSSDEECHRSPKKSPISTTAPLADNVDNDSEDFFAIHVVNTPTSPKEDKFSTIADDINMNNSFNHNNNNTSDLPNTTNANLNEQVRDEDDDDDDDDDFGDFADFETASDFMKPTELNGLVTADSITTSLVDSNQNVEALVEPPPDTVIPADDNDDDDFDDFQDFTSAPAPTPAVVPIISAPQALSITAENNNANTQAEPLKTDSVAPEVSKVVESAATSFDNDDDDDDFGDFEEATFETPASQYTSAAPVLQTPTPVPATTVSSANIGERLGSVLKMMFPTEGEHPAEDNELQQTAKIANNMNETLPLEAIEAAKALEFQWPQSEMRHALIRSIGIDSRNILFGDNWNPSMPRFAANLSFNPLKPMKPQTANTVPNTTTYADADAMQYSMNSGVSAAEPDISSYAKKTDVPDVEFDWQGTGLVNPLDGPKSETNTRETEAIQPTAPIARLDTPDDEQQSHTTFSSVGDNISETLSKNDNELTASPTRDDGPSPLALDNAAYQFTAPETGNTIISSTSASSLSSSSKPYDNSKPMTTLRLGANIVVDVDDDDETVVTSTYAGPLKETHIYTPSKADAAPTMKGSKTPVSGSEPIDFDYEIAAAGIIIDEKVVKKEYRDVEYNPGFSLEVVAEYAGELSVGVPGTLANEPSATAVTVPQAPATQQSAEFDTDEFTEFTEFQSMPPPPVATLPAADAHFGAPFSAASTITSKFPAELNAKAPLSSQPSVLPAAVAKAKEASKTPSRTNSPSIIDNMILSPAILLPQAIPISTNNGTANTKATPTIEWGDSTASINPDELARIEELFSQPKMPAVAAAKDVMNASQKTTPIHNYAEKHTKNNSISISASVAMKEQDSTLNDDYWSEFVSVPVTPQLPTNANRMHNNNNNNSINSNNKSNNNNQLVNTPKRMSDVHINNSANNSNNAMRSPRHQPQQQHQQNIHAQRTLTPTPQQKSAAHASTNFSAKSNVYNSNSNSNNSNDDDWSDFVSSTPTPASAQLQQQQHVTSYMPAAHAPQFNSAAWQNANFYNNPLGLYHQQASMQTRTSALTPQQQQLQLQQQIHIMQDFSTAPVANRPLHAMSNSNNANHSNQQHSNTSYAASPHLQVGSARVAPSISLIPDLGFVAPALPVHTAFVNVLPKTSFNSKK